MPDATREMSEQMLEKLRSLGVEKMQTIVKSPAIRQNYWLHIGEASMIVVADDWAVVKCLTLWPEAKLRIPAIINDQTHRYGSDQADRAIHLTE